MKYTRFLAEKRNEWLLMFFAVITGQIFLLAYKIILPIRLYTFFMPLMAYVICITAEFYKKKHLYMTLLERLDNLTEKYLINELMDAPNSMEEEKLKEILDELDKSMIENVNKYKFMAKDYKEYIELWIHEIKMPIAAGKMVIENHKDEVTKSIGQELDKIENYIEQALFYARSNNLEKDYMITKSELREIVNQSVIKNKSILILNKVSIDIHDVEKTVYADSKWTVFILSQILQNSVKYMKEKERKIEIWSEEQKENVTLFMKDNGIGIRQSDVERVFDKGFTGENGRKSGIKSTGIGLYLCKKLCNKSGLNIRLTSVEGEETIVSIVFPKNSYINI